MTLIDDRGLVEPDESETLLATEVAESAPSPESRSADEAERPTSVVLTGVSTLLATAAAGWMCAGVFRGGLARPVAVLGALIGVGIVTLSYRTRRPSFVQYLALPIAIVVGALLVLPDATGGSANLPSLVAEALRGGGIAQPPIPFDPGWRFILVVLMAVVGAAAASLATGLSRPKIGIVIPGPLLFAAALIQPQGATLTSSAVALVLFVSAFAVSYGVDLAKEGATSGEFELRRLGRAGGVLTVLVAALIVLSQAGFLFPEPSDQQVIPPKRPEVPPAQPDRVLFTVTAPRLLPIHLGVLDGYEDVAWLTPPFDPKRLQEVGPDGRLLPGGEVGEVPRLKAPAAGEELKATFNIADVQGHVLPSVPNPQRLVKKGFAVEYNPRTQDLRLPDGRAKKGMTYTVHARIPPNGKELAAAPAAPARLKEYVNVPAPPQAVRDLLVAAPTTNAFERLQYVRNIYYQNVVAAGAGDPIDVPPRRVTQMLAGKEATPYEITAGEVLLARWAGIPARVGYGYYGGKDIGEGRFEFRPKHGATWLEAYFEGYGWVPIIGTPPKAKASLTPAQKNENPAVRPTEELALLVYVPIRLQSVQLLYEIVRFWVLQALPWLFAAVLAFAFYPGALKILRRFRRRRWALAHGPPARVAVAYAELRDGVYDLNIGDPSLSPLKFLDAVAPDGEHTELAWLMTRGLWGDLARDLRNEDAESAEDMARSVLRRVRRANPALNRIVGFGSRVSLRNPYSAEVPNFWPTRSARRRARFVVPGVAVLLVAVVGVTVAGGGSSSAPPGQALPKALVPAESSGLTFRREVQAEASFRKAGREALVRRGQVYSIHDGAEIQGSFQVAEFKPGLAAQQRDVREGVLKSISGGRFELTRIGTERVFQLRLPEQRMLVWFPPDGRYYELMVARQGFDRAEQLFVNLLAFQRGAAAPDGDVLEQRPVDPRRTVKD